MLKKLILLVFPIILNAHHLSYVESFHDGWDQYFQIDRVLFEDNTEEQHLIIFENPIYGRVLALDGVIQVTENDEFVYHEMLSHVPIFSHGNVRSVLIIGGGDGGMLREVLRHEEIEKATLVEIDGSVIEMAKKYLPSISQGSFDNPKANIVIADGAEFIKNTDEKYDLIICDTSDPVGPNASLFTAEFYQNCHGALAEGGILVTQNGVPFLQSDELISTMRFLKEIFQDVSCFVAPVPTYTGGFMAFGWASDNKEYRIVPQEEIENRVEDFDGAFKYYTPSIHKGSFALPQFIEDKMF